MESSKYYQVAQRYDASLESIKTAISEKLPLYIFEARLRAAWQLKTNEERVKIKKKVELEKMAQEAGVTVSALLDDLIKKELLYRAKRIADCYEMTGIDPTKIDLDNEFSIIFKMERMGFSIEAISDELNRMGKKFKNLTAGKKIKGRLRIGKLEE